MDLSTVQLALVRLVELLHDSLNVAQALPLGAVSKLIVLLQSGNLTCRQKSAEALKLIANYATGRLAILEMENNILQLASKVD